MRPEIKTFFHEDTNTCCHVAWCADTRHAVIIDPVLDYEPASGKITTTFTDEILKFVRDRDLKIDRILETHAHADHLTSAQFLKNTLDCEVSIGEGIRFVQQTFVERLNLDGVATDGSQFDKLFTDGECFELGNLSVRVMHTPGHTNDSVTYVIGDAAFVGDTLFMPDSGTARCDFPGGDAERLFESIQKILALDADTRIMICHDYGGNGREFKWETTVREERETNIHLAGKSAEEYVRTRTARDAGLNMPRLIYPSIQVNIRAGQLPEAEANGTSYLKIPLTQS